MTTTEYQRRIDSLREGYLPGATLEIPEGLTLHTEAADELDPVVYEVLRSRLWNLNLDHMNVIRRISGSGICVYAWDFNTSIQTEDGEGVVFGPGILIFAGSADLVVKWTLEHRAGNVGIRPGDAFIQCDPWVGTNHAMDASVYAPVFVDGKLFCWVYNVVHQQETGGVEPGGFVQQARDVYSEPLGLPPLKLVEGGAIREDILDAWVRRSRLPELCRLEVKSQVAGVNFATARIEEAIDEYGADVVKGVMRRMIDNTEKALRARVATLPDGEWRDERYIAGSLPDDRKLHRLVLTIRKEGSSLAFSNKGTDPATGMFNTTPGNWRAAIVSSVLPLLAYDQYLCGAGALRCLSFEPDVGTITSCRRPAACGGSLGTVAAMTQSQYLLSKMMGSSTTLREDRLGASALHTHILNQVFGLDQHGRPYAGLSLDFQNGGTGACSTADGIDHGGGMISMRLRIGNVEDWERTIPFLYLYRRELGWSGGHGRWRGGAGLASAWTGHKTSESYMASGGLISSVTHGHGLSGAPPGSGGSMWYAPDTRVLDSLAAGFIPAEPDELHALAPHGALAPTKKFDNRLLPGDVFEVVPPTSAGLGDPVLRQADLVADDVRRGRLSGDDARRIYGVALDDLGGVDASATDSARAALLAGRLVDATRVPDTTEVAGADCRSVGYALETVEVVEADDDRRLACAQCRTILGAPQSGYREGCAWLETPLSAIDVRLYTDPSEQVDGVLILRQYLCPGCGHSLDADICTTDDGAYQDVRLVDGVERGST